MTKRFCDYCKKEISSEPFKLDIKHGEFPLHESMVGMYAGGEDEICFWCYMKLSEAIVNIKKSAPTKDR